MLGIVYLLEGYAYPYNIAIIYLKINKLQDLMHNAGIFQAYLRLMVLGNILLKE